jgi:hypothetical protein
MSVDGDFMKKAFVDFRISDAERINLERLDVEVLTVPPCEVLYEAICGHPDVLLHIVDDKTILVHKDMSLDFVSKLKTFDIDIILSKESLTSSYPGDIILNAVSLHTIFLHNLEFTDHNLLQLNKHKKLINTKQGYTKCSTAIVSKNAVITSDQSIAKALITENIDVLVLPPGDILLPGLDYGFIGGSCGLIDKNTIAFYGSLNNYAYGKEVLNFLKKHKVQYYYLSDGKLIDRGSILTIAKHNTINIQL